jgi:hypothetical protein
MIPEKRIYNLANRQGSSLAAFLFAWIIALPDARQGVQGGLSGLIARHGTITADGKALLVHATATTPWPVFQDERLDAGRHDPDAETLHTAVENDIELAARLERINRSFR